MDLGPSRWISVPQGGPSSLIVEFLWPINIMGQDFRQTQSKEFKRIGLYYILLNLRSTWHAFVVLTFNLLSLLACSGNSIQRATLILSDTRHRLNDGTGNVVIDIEDYKLIASSIKTKAKEHCEIHSFIVTGLC